MAAHSSILAWKILTEEPGRLQSMGSQRDTDTHSARSDADVSLI